MLKQAVIFFSFLITKPLLALTCSSPTTLSDPRVDAYSPEVAVNDTGDAAVVWILSQMEEEEVIQICSKSHTTGWAMPETISTPTKSVFNPLPHVDPAGNIFACWYIDTRQNIQTQFVEKLVGKSWTPPKNLITLNYDGDSPLVVFSQDHLVATYEERITDEDSLWGPKIINATMIPLKRGEEPKTCALSHLSTFSATNATLAGGRQGNAVAIWEETDNTSLLKSSIKNENDEWMPPEIIYQTLAGRTYEEGAAIDPKGNICVVWEYHTAQPNDETTSKVQAVTRCNGKWSDPVDLSSLTDKIEEPRVCSDDEGNFLVVWVSVCDHKHLIRAAFKPFGKSWLPTFTLSSPEEKSVQPQVKVDNKGHFVVIWKCKKNKISSIYGTEFFTKKQIWSQPVCLSPEGARCEEPRFVFDAQGKGTIVWTAISNGIDKMIQVATLNTDE